MNYQQDDEGWVAPDLTLLHPNLCQPGIRRMVRMRNPHQMVVVLLKSGSLAILHEERNAGVRGWSRINLNAPIQDICVIADSNGNDVLFATVTRFINGANVMYLEAFSNWTESQEWQYLQSSVNFSLATETNVVTDLEHLAGMEVEVVGGDDYLGQYTVSAGGTVTLVDQLGDPINVSSAIVGLSMRALMISMPMITDDPGGRKRYSDITVRINESARPLINGTRPKDRTPINPMGTTEIFSEGGDGSSDHTVENQGWSRQAYVRIEENLPLNVEVLGIFGKFTGQSV